MSGSTDGQVHASTCVGCAGWSIPACHAEYFPSGGSHLERYARRFPAVEINSSFYRPHRPATYARWASAVPDGFRFAVKLPREITHVRRLAGAALLLDRFLDEVAGLGAKLGPLLLQLPPSLDFDEATGGTFLDALRHRFDGSVVCEPRHASWFTTRAELLLDRFHVARVAADPARAPGDRGPGGWSGLVYYRLHGSPRIYYSAYAPGCLDTLARAIAAAVELRPVWCIFDNTAAGAAQLNALAVLDRLHEASRASTLR